MDLLDDEPLLSIAVGSEARGSEREGPEALG